MHPKCLFHLHPFSLHLQCRRHGENYTFLARFIVSLSVCSALTQTNAQRQSLFHQGVSVFFLFSPSSASATPNKWNTDQQEYAVSHARRCADLFVSLLSPRCSQVITMHRWSVQKSVCVDKMCALMEHMELVQMVCAVQHARSDDEGLPQASDSKHLLHAKS